MYELAFKRQALKALTRMPPQQRERIRRQLTAVARNPETYPGDWKPLMGSPYWRLRIGGWRVICDLRKNEMRIVVLKVGPRGDVYK